MRNNSPDGLLSTHYSLLTTYYLPWRKFVTLFPFIFRHFLPKTLTNINIQPTHPRNNIYLRCQNK